MQRCLNEVELRHATTVTEVRNERVRERGIMRFWPFVLLAVWILCGRAQAGSLLVTVKDGQGTLVSDAVVYAKPNRPVVSLQKKQAVIEQRDKQFVPYVTAIQVSTS